MKNLRLLVRGKIKTDTKSTVCYRRIFIEPCQVFTVNKSEPISRDTEAGTLFVMLIEAAGLSVGLATVLAPEVALARVDHHVFFQAGPIGEALPANITGQRAVASRSLKHRIKTLF